MALFAVGGKPKRELFAVTFVVHGGGSGRDACDISPLLTRPNDVQLAHLLEGQAAFFRTSPNLSGTTWKKRKNDLHRKARALSSHCVLVPRRIFLADRARRRKSRAGIETWDEHRERRNARTSHDLNGTTPSNSQSIHCDRTMAMMPKPTPRRSSVQLGETVIEEATACVDDTSVLADEHSPMLRVASAKVAERGWRGRG